MDAGRKKCGKWNTYVTMWKLVLVFRVDFRLRFDELTELRGLEKIDVLLNHVDAFSSSELSASFK